MSTSSYDPITPRARIGFIIPSSNRMVEPQMQRLMPAGVVPHFTRIGMTNGQTVYYDVHVTNHSGRDLVAASAIKDRREADWLVSEMQRALKLEKPAWSPAIKLAGN